MPSSLQIVGMDAREPLALRLDLGPRAAHLVHVGRRAADVGDDARELRVGRHLPQLAEDRLLRRDWMIRPWCAVIEQNVQPPKQPRMIVHRVLDHLERRDRLAAVHRVRPARVRQAVDPVHVVLADRQGRRVARRPPGGRGTARAVVALSGFVSWWMILVASANGRLSALTSS